MNPRPLIARVAALCAAAFVTTTLLGSQLGLAVHFCDDADSQLAAARAAKTNPQAAATAPAGRGA